MQNLTKRQVTSVAHIRAKEKGIALISVLWLVALLGLFAATIVVQLRNETLISKNTVLDAQAEGIADAAVYQVLHDITDPNTAKDIPIDGHLRTLSVLGHDVEVSVEDEYGKIDINFATKDILLSLLCETGLSKPDSTKIVDAIEDRRSSIIQKATDARALDHNYSFVVVPFRTISELKTIPGITDEVFEYIKPALTVYSQQSNIVITTAPSKALLALPGLDQPKVDTIMSLRQSKPPTINDIGLTQGPSGQNGLEGRSFSIVAKARIGEGIFIRHAVVRITGDTKRLFWILDWSTQT